MRHVEVSLVEFLDDAEGGVRLLGRTRDPAIVALVRDALMAERRAELARLDRDVGKRPRPRLRPVGEPGRRPHDDKGSDS